MKKIEIEWQGERKIGAVARAGSVTWFSLDGEVWMHESTLARKRGGAAMAVDPARILAPMPGKIVKIAAAVGQKVGAGDTVIVMEAMKMEYTLKAAAAGVVKSVACKAGEQVALGAELAVLELADG